MYSRDYSKLKNSISSYRSYGSIYESQILSDSAKLPLSFSLFSSIAQTLRLRRDLFDYRRLISKFSLVVGLFGLSLAILDNQLSVSFSQPLKVQKTYLMSFVIKFCITLTTVILIILILIYHYLDLQIEMQRHNINDWKLGLSCRRIVKFISEVIICSLQPLPVNYKLINTSYLSLNQTTYDAIMTIMMCLRLYLLARVLILRSTLHQDISAQSFGAISHTSVNTKFIFKSWMTLYSIYILIVLIIFILIWGGWATTVCEVTFSFSDSLWLTAVTFLSIGYGDIIPTTPCGRAVAVLIGALGAGCTALIVAIVSSKLELTQSEKYVHNFVQDSQLNKRVEHLSANIIKYSWRLYKEKCLKKNGKKSKQIVFHQRQLFITIRQVRYLRAERRQLSDSNISILEVRRVQMDSQKFLDELNEEVSLIENRLQSIYDKLT